MLRIQHVNAYSNNRVIVTDDNGNMVDADVRNNTAIYAITDTLDYEWYTIVGIPRSIINGKHVPDDLTSAPLWAYRIIDYRPPFNHVYILAMLLGSTYYDTPHDMLSPGDKPLRYSLNRHDIEQLQHEHGVTVDDDTVQMMKDDMRCYWKTNVPLNVVVNGCPFNHYDNLPHYHVMTRLWQGMTMAERAVLLYKATDALPDVDIF